MKRDGEEEIRSHTRRYYRKSRGICARRKTGNKNMVFLDGLGEGVELSSRQMDVTCCLETGSIPQEEGGRGAIQEEGKSNAVSVQTGETFL